ncbi:MAG TPA: DUF2586 family protein, partial [Polyangiaceae bacterium]|nr:DUF2586 family protein [Polyangiaceae bacterium]
VAASNAGTNGTVTRTGSGPSSGVTVSGAPLDDYQGVVRIKRGGAVGTATFDLSIDGGKTFSAEYVSAASVATFAAKTGLTLAFAAGTYVAGDTYTWGSAGPTYSTNDLNAALDALKFSAYPIEWVHVVGTVGGVDDATKVTNFAALVVAVAAEMEEWFQAGRFAFAIVEAPDVPDAAFNVSAIQNLSTIRVHGAGGYATVVSQVDGAQRKRSVGWPYATQLARVAVHESPGWVEKGPVPGVLDIARDEFKSEALDPLRFTTMRTFNVWEIPGFFLTRGQGFAPPGSDFALVQKLRVMNRACSLVRAAFGRFVNYSPLVSPSTGFIDEGEALAIDRIGERAIRDGLMSGATPSVSGCKVTVVLDHNVQGTRKLLVRVRVIPRADVEFLETVIGFSNPALEAALCPPSSKGSSTRSRAAPCASPAPTSTPASSRSTGRTARRSPSSSATTARSSARPAASTRSRASTSR